MVIRKISLNTQHVKYIDVDEGLYVQFTAKKAGLCCRIVKGVKSINIWYKVLSMLNEGCWIVTSSFRSVLVRANAFLGLSFLSWPFNKPLNVSLNNSYKTHFSWSTELCENDSTLFPENKLCRSKMKVWLLSSSLTWEWIRLTTALQSATMGPQRHVGFTFESLQ